MPGTRNSKPARTSKRPREARVAPRVGGWLGVALALILLSAWSAAAIWFVRGHGWQFWYGDAEAHLNIARRVVDSRTPGYDQIGTVWLPLPHLLMLPLVRHDEFWRNGLAAAIPMGACFVLAGAFLFAAVRRIFASASAGAAATVLFAVNPNLLYLQSTAMSEAVFLAPLMALLYATVRFRDSQGWGWVAGAGVAACLCTLTRYEGWFLIPFAALYFLCAARQRRILTACVFAAVACVGPLYWLGHNWWLTGDPLEFYRGPYSAAAIQKGADYPGRGDWSKAFLYFRTAVEMCAGPALLWMAIPGAVVALVRRAWWPLLLLVLPGAFFVWSMHSSAGTPIFVPTLWPHSYYNTRYGLALLPLLVLAAASLVTAAPRGRAALAALVIAAGAAQWAFYPRSDTWITWKESQVNSEARRAWTHDAAQYLGQHYVRGGGILTSFGDLSGVLREAGIPLRESFTADNGIPFEALLRRPDLHLRGEWALVMGGDPVQTVIWKGPRFGIHYRLVQTIVVKGAPVIEIYRR